MDESLPPIKVSINTSLFPPTINCANETTIKRREIDAATVWLLSIDFNGCGRVSVSLFNLKDLAPNSIEKTFTKSQFRGGWNIGTVLSVSEWCQSARSVLAGVTLLSLTWPETMASGNSSTSQAHFLQMVSQTRLRITLSLISRLYKREPGRGRLQ